MCTRKFHPSAPQPSRNSRGPPHYFKICTLPRRAPVLTSSADLGVSAGPSKSFWISAHASSADRETALFRGVDARPAESGRNPARQPRWHSESASFAKRLPSGIAQPTRLASIAAVMPPTQLDFPFPEFGRRSKPSPTSQHPPLPTADRAYFPKKMGNLCPKIRVPDFREVNGPHCLRGGGLCKSNPIFS